MDYLSSFWQSSEPTLSNDVIKKNIERICEFEENDSEQIKGFTDGELGICSQGISWLAGYTTGTKFDQTSKIVQETAQRATSELESKFEKCHRSNVTFKAADISELRGEIEKQKQMLGGIRRIKNVYHNRHPAYYFEGVKKIQITIDDTQRRINDLEGQYAQLVKQRYQTPKARNELYGETSKHVMDSGDFLVKIYEDITKNAETPADIHAAIKAYPQFDRNQINIRQATIKKDLDLLTDVIKHQDVSNEELLEHYNFLCRVLRQLDSVERLALCEDLFDTYSRTWNTCFEAKELVKSKFPKQKNRLADPIIREVIKPDGTITYVVTYLAPPFESMVLRGGGAKGVGYGPALDELNKSGMLDGLQKVIGSSAGAIMAVGIGTGNLDKMKQLVDSLDMNWICKEDCQSQYPDIKFNFGYLDMELTNAQNAVRLFDEISTKSVQTYLNDNWNQSEFQNKLRQYNFLERAQQLKDQDLNAEPRKESDLITFRDILILHKLEPKKFKETILTAFDENTYEEHYFSAENVPNMPLAYAARASMAIPPVFTPVEMDLDKYVANPTGKPDVRILKDGGIGSNLPSEYFYRNVASDEEIAHVCETTLIMTFDDQGKAHQIQHTARYEREGTLNMSFILLPNDPEREKSSEAEFSIDVIKNKDSPHVESSPGKAWFAGNPKLSDVEQKDQRKVYDSGPNAYVTYHGDISTFDLSIWTPTKKRLEMAKFYSRKKALQSIDQQKLRGTEVMFSSREEAEAKAEAERRPEKLWVNPLSMADDDVQMH